MTTVESTQLQSFHRFIARKLEMGIGDSLSPEEALAQWRAEQETLTAIREGLADVEAGRTKSLAEFDRDFRQRHNL